MSVEPQQDERCPSDSDGHFSENTMDNDSDELKSAFKLTDFDFCKLVSISEKSKIQCYLCKKEKHKKTKTSFLCGICDVPCCLKCYDRHRREKLCLEIRDVIQKNATIQIQVSKCGEFLEMNDEASDEEQTINHGTKQCMYIKPPLLKKEELPSCSGNLGIMSDLKEQSFHMIKPAISSLKEDYKSIPEVFFDSQGNIKCMYFQDSHMKDFFNFYSHRVCIDFSFRLVDLNFIVVFFLAEDSNGQSEIISVAFVRSASCIESVTWMLSVFKKHNPSWRNIKMLVMDPSFENRDIVRNYFPEANMLMCFYQVSRTFQKYIYNSFELTDISYDQKKNAYEIFENMAVANTEMEYSLLYQQLQLLDNNIVDYFDRVWGSTRSEWRIKIEYHESILHSLNGFLVFIASKFEPVLCNSSDMNSFIHKFFFITKLLRMEKKHRIMNIEQSASLSMYSKFTPQFHISKILTPYAAEFVNRQLDMSAEITINPPIMLDSYVFCHFGTSVVASSSNCSCKFYTLTFLPCCHIFAVRRILGVPVFDDILCDMRWTERYYISAHTSLCNDYEDESNKYFNKDSFNAGSEIINKMLQLISKCNSTFSDKTELLNRISLSWQKNEDVCLRFEGKGDSENIHGLSYLKPEQFQEDDTTVKEESDDSMSSPSDAEDYSMVPAAVVTSVPVVNDAHRKKDPKPEFLTFEWEFGKEIFSGKHINFIYVTCVICNTKESCIKWLQHMGYLHASMPCSACGYQMQQESATRLTDGSFWVCRNDKGTRKSCGKRCSVRRGTWLERTNMSLEQILTFAYMWIHKYHQQQIISELGIAYATYTVWEKYFRRICISIVKERIREDDNLDENSNNSEERDYEGEWLTQWYQLRSGEDPFIAFLTDAKSFHENSLTENKFTTAEVTLSENK